MKILYDGEIFRMQPWGGVNRYFINLISHLPNDVYPKLAIDYARDRVYPSHPNLRVLQLWRRRLDNFSYRLSSYLARIENAMVRQRLAQESFDVYHPTYYTFLTGSLMRAPLVITVWDMIHELFAPQLDPLGQHAADKRRAIERAHRIICISENTKKDLLERLDVAENKILVTHLAPELDRSMSYGCEIVPSRPYYLYVGGRGFYKNFSRLVEAFARARASQKDLALCVVGDPLTVNEKRLIGELGLAQHVEHFGNVTDEHLAKLYRCSIALVYPSLYEGFGIPPLEAMSCGTVAIVSNVSSLPEVVGDAGILFDPYSEEELTNILVSLPEEVTLRNSLIDRGAERAKTFTWEKTVAQTVEIYRSLA